MTQSTQGGHIATRARGRTVYVAPRHYGPPRYYGGGYNRGRYIAGDVAAGIAGAIILNEVARPRYYYSEGGLTCRQLEARCDAGQDWACRRLDRDPGC